MADYDEISILGEAAMTFHPAASSQEVQAVRNEREHGLPRAQPPEQSVLDQFAANRAKRAGQESR